MQENARIKIDEELLNSLGRNEVAKNMLTKFFEENLKAIHDLLFNYHYEKRERVYELRIEENSLVFEGNKGSFRVLYMIGFFNACADLDYNAPEKMKIDFSIHKEPKEILLTGEYWPERGQDEI
jgi:hypothetical protein